MTRTTREEALERLIEAAEDARNFLDSGDEGTALYVIGCDIRNALAALSATDDEWQLIETAPLDGTPIWVFTTCHGQVEAWFKPGEWHDYGETREYDGHVWVCADDAFQIEIEETPNSLLHGTATHWRPLPPLPSCKQTNPIAG